MNDMTAGLHKTTNKALALSAWREHRLSAVKAFLKNAVVIDNEPTGFDQKIATGKLASALVADDGMTVMPPALAEETSVAEEKADEELESHELNVRATSDAFAEAGIACAFVLPDDNDSNEEGIKRRILNAAAFADIVVIDWYLRDKNSNLTRDILASIAYSDTKQNGRMRLICVYTGQETNPGIIDDAKKALEKGGVVVEDIPESPNCAKGANCLLMVLNKSEVTSDRLPQELMTAFTELADGLLPAFALAAVAAIRDNVHHMVTRFGAELDAAYVANRIITDPPGDVAELVRELFVAECDNALGLNSVADSFLERAQITKWLDATEQPRGVADYDSKDLKGKKITVKLDRKFLNDLLEFGVDDKYMLLDKNGSKQEFPEYKRQLVARVLNDGEASRQTEQKFARLVALKREAFGGTRLTSDSSSWRPSLTTGTLLKLEGDSRSGSQFFMCLTPACDTLRLEDTERGFVFLGNSVAVKPDRCNLVILDENKTSQCLFFDRQSPNIVTLFFKGDAVTGRVQATIRGDGEISSPPIFEFKTSNHEEHKLIWLGEVRYSRASSDMADLMRNWMRIGINDSEFLRLAAKGSAKLTV